MVDPTDIEQKLRELTQRQCEILYWVCRGKVYKEIALQMHCGQDLIQLEMSRMYASLGLKQKNTQAKRRLLNTLICPIHEKLVSDPAADCSKRVIEVTEPVPVQKDLEEVKKDERAGLIPLDRSLVISSSERALATQPPSSLTLLNANQRAQRVNGFLVGLTLLFATLLVGALLVIAYMATGPSPQAESTPPQATQPLAAATVVVPQTVIVTQTLIVLQPPPTPLPSPSLVQPTVTIRAQPTVTQPSVANAPCSPRSGTVNLIGKVPSDIPGTSICVGDTVTSVMDSNTKPRDVYSISLVAGQEIRFTVEMSAGCVWAHFYNPSSKSIETQKTSQAFDDGWICGKYTHDYTPAISGLYYFALDARDTSVIYNFNSKTTTSSVPGNKVASDIPGTRLALGSTNASVIDNNTKPRDVYSVSLVAGQAVRFILTMNSGCAWVHFYNPSSQSIAFNKFSQAFDDGWICGKYTKDYTAAVAGTYYFGLDARDTGVTYTINWINLR